MDFRQQTPQPVGNRPAPTVVTPSAPDHKEVKHSEPKEQRSGKLMRVMTAVILIGVAVLIAGIALALAQGARNNEFKYVDTSKYQAVFLNNGQVYFGDIDSLNSKYVHMTNIYYLTQSTATTTTASSYSLVKLGCQQIHDPYDAMVINRDQITFWENLNSDGKVVASIKAFQKANPNGPDCSQVSSQTQATSSTTQGSTTTGTGTSTTGTGTSTTGTGTTGTGSTTTK